MTKGEFVWNEYPRPQFQRKDWVSLNGVWNFAFDDAGLGEGERWFEQHDYALGNQCAVCLREQGQRNRKYGAA